MKRVFGLIGFPLAHSFSQTYFSEKFFREGIHDCEYRNFPIENIGMYHALLSSVPNLRGLNVTIPFKQSVMKHLDEADETAGSIGAVNCIRITGSRSYGFNTDAPAFQKTLSALLGHEKPKALILGNGGASRAVQFVLKNSGISFMVVTRKSSAGAISYAELSNEIVSEHRLIINTTPAGQFPDTHLAPQIPYSAIGKNHVLYDLIYNPSLTTFLSEGRQRGAQIKNGMEMLNLQAELSWEIWNS